MNKKKVYLYLFDGFGDSAASFVLPQLKKNNFDIITFSLDKREIISLGGIKVLVDKTLIEVDQDSVDMMIIPGGSRWMENEPVKELSTFITSLHHRGKSIAAICGATVLLAKIGLLDNVNHTSNTLDYLINFAPQYQGKAHYIDTSVVKDKEIITASGPGTLEFSLEILNTLKVHESLDISQSWYNLFKHGIIPPHSVLMKL